MDRKECLMHDSTYQNAKIERPIEDGKQQRGNVNTCTCTWVCGFGCGGDLDTKTNRNLLGRGENFIMVAALHYIKCHFGEGTLY
jgi:hypothetical protein